MSHKIIRVYLKQSKPVMFNVCTFYKSYYNDNMIECQCIVLIKTLLLTFKIYSKV